MQQAYHQHLHRQVRRLTTRKRKRQSSILDFVNHMESGIRNDQHLKRRRLSPRNNQSSILDFLSPKETQRRVEKTGRNLKRQREDNDVGTRLSKRRSLFSTIRTSSQPTLAERIQPLLQRNRHTQQPEIANNNADTQCPILQLVREAASEQIWEEHMNRKECDEESIIDLTLESDDDANQSDVTTCNRVASESHMEAPVEHDSIEDVTDFTQDETDTTDETRDDEDDPIFTGMRTLSQHLDEKRIQAEVAGEVIVLT